MASSITISNTFASQAGPIPLSQLDANFTQVTNALNNTATFTNYAVDTGAANAYAVSFASPTTVSYAAGLTITFKAVNANTTASTLNVNSLGAKNIVNCDGSALGSGQITAGSMVTVSYDGTNFQLMNDPSGEGTVANLTVAGNLTLSGGTANGVAYLNGSKVVTTGSALTFDGANLGVGVTPSAWRSTEKAVQFGTVGSVSSYNGITANLRLNSYTDSGGTERYITNGTAQVFGLYNNAYTWNIAASGTAGGAISYTTSMTLDGSGNLGIGTSSPSARVTTKAAANNYTSGALALVAATSGTSYLTNVGGTFCVSNDGSSNHLLLDSSGNLGLGVTPSAWSFGKAYELGYAGNALWNTGSAGQVNLLNNAYYNGSYKYGVTGYASYYQQDTGKHVWYIAPSGTAGNAISFTQAMTLDASGRLLVGGSLSAVSGSNNLFQVGGISNARMVIDSPDTQGVYFTKSGVNNGTYRVDASGNFEWYTKNVSQAMVLDANGNLLVGTTSGSSRLTVSGTSASFSSPSGDCAVYINGENASGANAVLNLVCPGSNQGYIRYARNNDRIEVQAGGANGVYLAQSGTAWQSLSDERQKTDLEPIQDAANKVNQLRAVIGRYLTDDESKRRSFLIAQDVQAVLPEAVDIAKEDGTLGLAYTDVIPLLVAAIKELTARVAQLEAK